MTEEQSMVCEFQRRCGAVTNDRPTLPGAHVHRLRVALIEEELAEFRNAGQREDLVGVADALADLLYTIYGAGVSYGIDLEPVFREIHRSNMSKSSSVLLHRPDGKLPKGANYSPPRVKETVAAQMHPAAVVLAR
jgi:predicted HAD superfamily Cof-like phosphohydrolase